MLVSLVQNSGFWRRYVTLGFGTCPSSGIPRKNALGNGISRSSGYRLGRHLLRLILQNELFSITGHVNLDLTERHWLSLYWPASVEELPTLSSGDGNSSSIWNVSFLKYQRQTRKPKFQVAIWLHSLVCAQQNPGLSLITRLQKRTDALHSRYATQNDRQK